MIIKILKPVKKKKIKREIKILQVCEPLFSFLGPVAGVSNGAVLAARAPSLTPSRHTPILQNLAGGTNIIRLLDIVRARATPSPHGTATAARMP